MFLLTSLPAIEQYFQISLQPEVKSDIRLSDLNHCKTGNWFPIIPTQEPTTVLASQFGFNVFLTDDRTMSKRISHTAIETVFNKPIFAQAIHSRRCLIPCTSFVHIGKDKKEYMITLPKEKLFCVAGIWNNTKMPEKGIIDSFTIFTMSNVNMVKNPLQRIPLILSPEHEYTWMNYTIQPKDLVEIISPIDSNYIVVSSI